MKLPSFKRSFDISYLSDMHLYVDDIRELQELRYKAGNPEEVERYTRLIEGAQRVLEYMQDKVTEGEK